MTTNYECPCCDGTGGIDELITFDTVHKKLKDAKCQTCMGLGKCDDAEPGDISFNTWQCTDCGGSGFAR